MSPVRGFHHHFPQYGGMVQHSGPAENCDRPSLGPLTDHRPGRSSDPTEDGCECHGGTEVASCEHCVEIWASRSSDPEPAPDLPYCQLCGCQPANVEHAIETQRRWNALRAVPALQATPEPAPLIERIEAEPFFPNADGPTHGNAAAFRDYRRRILAIVRGAVPALQATEEPHRYTVDEWADIFDAHLDSCMRTHRNPKQLRECFRIAVRAGATEEGEMR